MQEAIRFLAFNVHINPAPLTQLLNPLNLPSTSPVTRSLASGFAAAAVDESSQNIQSIDNDATEEIASVLEHEA